MHSRDGKEATTTTVVIQKMFPHDDYDRSDQDNDLMLLKVVFNYLHYIILHYNCKIMGKVQIHDKLNLTIKIPSCVFTVGKRSKIHRSNFTRLPTSARS